MNLIFRKSAEKDLLRFPKPLRIKIFQKIGELRNNPFPMGSLKLEGEEGYRIRIGTYRVIYTVDKNEKVIIIVRIAHRREIYR